MGSHGLYVWLSYGAAVAVVSYNVLAVRLRERRYLRERLGRVRRHGGPVAGNSNSERGST
jgi:heme exporter protein D